MPPEIDWLCSLLLLFSWLLCPFYLLPLSCSILSLHPERQALSGKVILPPPPDICQRLEVLPLSQAGMCYGHRGGGHGTVRSTGQRPHNSRPAGNARVLGLRSPLRPWALAAGPCCTCSRWGMSRTLRSVSCSHIPPPRLLVIGCRGVALFLDLSDFRSLLPVFSSTMISCRF